MSTPATLSDDFAAIVAIPKFDKQIDIASLFHTAHTDAAISPIDQFIENCLPLNLLWAKEIDQTKDVAPEMGFLLILGYVSAVESFMRALIRRVILCDPFSQKCCESLPISFGAVLHHEEDALPDALLEESVFSGKVEIIKALTRYIGFTIPNSSALAELLNQFEQICQLRHCCVHRFGKLGTKNAIALGGLTLHKACLEKPIRLTGSSTEAIARLVFILAKSINTEVFRFVIARSATGDFGVAGQCGIGWTWDAEQDSARFAPYYSVFATEKDAQKSPDMAEMYERFRTAHHKTGKKSGGK